MYTVEVATTVNEPIVNIKEASQIVGGLSTPHKMPSYCYNLPAECCRTGSRLHKIKGSVCSKCYARKYHYTIGYVKKALYRRLECLSDPKWGDAMTFLINARKETYNVFRWHDSGDLQSLKHFEMILNVVRRTPDVIHWLPTKETNIIQQYLDWFSEPFPKNLCIRVSMYYINEKPKHFFGLPTSTVESGVGFICPVSNGGQEGCDDYGCRACWDKTVKNVDYHLH